MASDRGDFIIWAAGITERKLNVPSGKDVLSEILSVCRQGFGVRVLGAEGAVSTCTLKQRGSSIAAPYTGDFLIGLLRGVFLPPIEEGSGGGMITNGLEISLRYKTKKSWRKIEGIISDRLTVARQVVVTLYAFKVDGEKLKKRLDEVGKDAVLDEVVDAPPTTGIVNIRFAPEPTSTSNSGVVVGPTGEKRKAAVLDQVVNTPTAKISAQVPKPASTSNLGPIDEIPQPKLKRIQPMRIQPPGNDKIKIEIRYMDRL